MQKKLIALAIAGLSGAAFAQSNVSVYGVVDVGYARLSGLTNTKAINAIESGLLGGSRVGFKGAEDLGNGMKAIFTLEYALAVDDNVGVGSADQLGDTGTAGSMSGTAARQTWAGLTGSFGTVLAGRAQTAGYDWAAAYNPLAGSAIDTAGKLKAATLLAAGTSGRASNAFAYVSPTFGGGFTVAYNHARLTEGSASLTNVSDNYANLLGATYANGPLAVGLVYAKISKPSTAATDDVKEWGLGASYNFGVATLYGNYQTQKDDSLGSSNDKKYSIGVVFPVGSGAIIGSYAKNKLDNNSTDNDSTSAVTVAYVHNLSKRTKLYAGYNVVSNSTNATAGLGSYVPTAGTGDDPKVLGFGINHSF